jgi:hypothetical protein
MPTPPGTKRVCLSRVLGPLRSLAAFRFAKPQWDGAITVDPDKRNPQDLIRVEARQSDDPKSAPEPADVFLATNILLEDGFTPMIGEDGSR